MNDVVTLVFEKKRVVVIFGLEMILSSIGTYSLVLASRCIGQCFVTPCELRPGLSTLWAVDSASSFGLIVNCISFFLLPFLGLYFTQKRVRHFSAGFFVGFMVLLSVNAVMLSCQWYQRAAMLSALRDSPDGGVVVNAGFVSAAYSLSLFMALYSTVSIALLSVLCYARGEASIFGPMESTTAFSAGKSSDYYTLPSADRSEHRLLVPSKDNPFEEADEEHPLVSI